MKLFKKEQKEYNENKELKTILVLILFLPIIFFLLDALNIGTKLFPFIKNLNCNLDWLSFVGSYAGTIISAFFLIMVTKWDRKNSNNIIKASQRPYLDVNYTIVDTNFIKEYRTNINRKIYFYDLFGQDIFSGEKEFIALEIHNTGESTAIINVNKSMFTIKYKRLLGIHDGEEKVEDASTTIKLNSIVKRKAIASGDSMYIIINSALMYNQNAWKLWQDVNITNTTIYFKDLFNCEYKDICYLEKGKVVPEYDNKLMYNGDGENYA